MSASFNHTCTCREDHTLAQKFTSGTLAQKVTSGTKQRQQQSHSVIIIIQEAGLYCKSVAGKVDFHDSQQQDDLFVICLFVR